MVQITERVWPAWRQQVEEFDEPEIVLLLAPAGDADSAQRALTESVAKLTRAYEAELERGGESAFPGEWDWVRVHDGLLVKVVECEDLEAMLPAVADGLARRGVEGTLDLHERPTVTEPPTLAPLLECRLRVRGERLHRELHFFDWRPDREVLDVVASGAARWCDEYGGWPARSLSVDVAPTVPLERGDDVVARMRDAIGYHTRVGVNAVSEDGFRIAEVYAPDGGVSLVEGGATVAEGRWTGALAELIDVLRGHADLVVYGFVKRGCLVSSARLGDSLTHDWPERPDIPLLRAEVRGAAFQDMYAPDAFGVQLLGPGYGGRVPEAGAWRQERVGDGMVLLEHVDLAAWFDSAFVAHGPAATVAGPAPPPPVLVRAREELAPILFTRAVLDAATDDAAGAR